MAIRAYCAEAEKDVDVKPQKWSLDGRRRMTYSNKKEGLMTKAHCVLADEEVGCRYQRMCSGDALLLPEESKEGGRSIIHVLVVKPTKVD